RSRASVMVLLFHIPLMFYSVYLVTGRNAKYGLIWRDAFCGSARRLDRRAIVQVSVSDTW
ncbi:hypothetical protein V3C99_011111, partial [Haemonchus contortus]